MVCIVIGVYVCLYTGVSAQVYGVWCVLCACVYAYLFLYECVQVT